MTMSVVYSNVFGGVVSTYVPDTLGSTVALVNSSGAMTDRWEYWPYDEVVRRTGTSVTPLTFLGVIGYFKDLLDKLLYVRARHLRVDLARWLTVDSIWPCCSASQHADGLPQTATDASGLDCGFTDSLDCELACTCETVFSAGYICWFSGDCVRMGAVIVCYCRCIGQKPTGNTYA